MSPPGQITSTPPPASSPSPPLEERVGERRPSTNHQLAAPARNGGGSRFTFHVSRFTFTLLIRFFASLRLTVACLALGLVLVFIGTLAQVDLGLFKAQNEFFRSFLVFWGPKTAAWKVPVLPGGYLVGGVLLIKLLASHIKRFEFTRNN